MCLFMALVFAACGNDDAVDTPEEATAVDQDNDLTAATIDSNYVYELPVIFHVLYQNASDANQYIPAARLKNILQYVNEIYQGGIYGESQAMNVKFVLAEYDESGKKLSTPGVEYVKYSGEYPIDVTKFMKDNTGANTKYIWDPNDYINVMMFNFKSDDATDGVTLGISHMPLSVSDTTALAGLQTTTSRYISKSNLAYAHCSAINSTYANLASTGGYYQSSRYVNGIQNGYTIVPSDVVVTLAHELGHYLGLFHMFTESEEDDSVEPADSCADTDYCEDTPSYNRSEYESYLTYYMENNSSPQLNDVILRHACDGTTFFSANIMDYSYSLGYKISADQKARVRHVLYYSPLIPGPKKNGVNMRSRAASNNEKLNLRPVIIR